jgi:2-polyprenyl-3-methyl-5-hydroxy-6-metoxy-1,4-benzoquinol methylase
MKLTIAPQSILEWIALKLGIVPTPIAHTSLSYILSRAVIEAHQINVFETIQHHALTLEQIASATQTNPRALRSLLNVLISADYLHYKNEKYSLSKMAKKWCLKESKDSVHDEQVFNKLCWDWMGHMGEYLKTGKGIQYHDSLTEDEWQIYQKAMENIAANSARAGAKMLPKLKPNAKILDIGGSHGLYCIELCKIYPEVEATIFDLPPAVDKAAPILQSHYSGNKIKYQKGDALQDEFGVEEYDLILVSSLMHHFTPEQNVMVSKKIAKALKPNGYFVIQEFIRAETANKMEMTGVLGDLFFNVSSTSGNWSAKELIGFQESAGLIHKGIKRFLTPPSFVQVVAQKN